MLIYSSLPGAEHAAYYYRVQIPLNTMSELGLDAEAIIDNPTARLSMEERMKAFACSDISLFYQPVGPWLLQNIEQLKKFGAGKDVDGTWKWPPSVVVDTDDNLFEITPFNRAYKDFGTRANGITLEPGAEVGCQNAEGEKVVLWRDGERGFDVARNLERMETYRALITGADAVTCTTARVAEYVTRESGQKNTYVFPNCVRLNDYPTLGSVEVRKKDPKEIRIMWQGGPSHYDDLEPLRAAFAYITRRYPHVKWVFWGFLFPWVYSAIPNDRFEFIPWLTHAAYRQRLFHIGHDIALAPLVNNAFNTCRSAIKFYENSIVPNPPAMLAQRTGPYLDEIKDGETGILFNDSKDFIDKISLLIENEELRRTLGANAKDWVIENRDAHRHTPKLYEFYASLREEKKRLNPPSEIKWNELLERSRAEEAANGIAAVEINGAVEGAEFAAKEA
jgi:glycosyltransferase involved in cell wall biosynthesis